MKVNWSKVGTVAWVEYRQFVLTKTFLFLLLLSPVLIGVVILVTVIASTSRDLSDRRFLVADQTGLVYEGLVEAARRHNTHDIFKRGSRGPAVQGEARFIPERVALPEDGDARRLQAELSDRVRAGEASAFVIIESGRAEGSGAARLLYFSENRTYQPLPNWLEENINRILQNALLEEAGLDPREVRRLTARRPLERFGLAVVDEQGEVTEAERDDPLITFLLPLAAMLILFFCANMSSPILLNTVMEEKMQKIMEVLLSAVTPYEMLMGKLIGSVFVSVTLGIVYIFPGLGFLFWRGYADAVPADLLFWFPVFLLLTLFSIGAIWASIGAACSELRDTQNFAGVAVMVLMGPFIFAMVILESPHTPFAVVSSMLPAFYPFLMTIRLLAAPGPEWWQLWGGLAVNLVFTVFTVWAGARIFRRGLLAQGSTPGFRRMLAWIREKD